MKTDLVLLIDQLGPLNNSFRGERNPVLRVEIMWDVGELLQKALETTDFTLDRLLYAIYDPHSTRKASYITRDFLSNSFRVRRYFKKRTDISKQLEGLQVFDLFREVLPLLSNPRYGLSDQEKVKLLELAKSGKGASSSQVRRYLRAQKKAIVPIANPRTPKRSDKFSEQKLFLESTRKSLLEIYRNFEIVPEDVNQRFKPNEREALVRVLMAIASDQFTGNIESIATSEEKGVKSLLSVASGSNRDKAAFRRWVMSSSELLNLAEGLHALGSKQDYGFFRGKFLGRRM